MLSSLDDNGCLPEVTVLVADFGLCDGDREALRLSAGRLGERMRFVPLSPDSPQFVVRPSFSMPWPLMGRFVLPGEIDAPCSRLLLIDSDMIVNASLRPLFEGDMEGHPLAAVHDPGQSCDYFNAGLMLIDVDAFNGRDLGRAAMRRLAEYPQRPTFLDQDALNSVLAGDWLRLDRSWNFFYAADPVKFEREDYDQARIAHFAGPKPWEDFGVTPTPLYERHALQAQARQPRLAPALDDLAFEKPALTSSTCRWSRSPDRAVDACGANGALIAATYGFHTDEEDQPWWSVDLLQLCRVEAVAIVNRPTERERFSFFVIETSADASSWAIADEKDSGAAVTSDLFAPWRVKFGSPILCHYVRIRLLTRGPLHLRRIQVFGQVVVPS